PVQLLLKIGLDQVELAVHLLQASGRSDHPAVVPEITLDLPGNRRAGVCRETRALAGVIADHRLHEAHPRHLDQVVPFNAATRVPPGDAIGNVEIQQHRLLLQPSTLTEAWATGAGSQDGLGQRLPFVAGGFSGGVNRGGRSLKGERRHRAVRSRTRTEMAPLLDHSVGLRLKHQSSAATTPNPTTPEPGST